MYPTRPSTGDPSQTPLDRALKGSQQSPVDDSDTPIICTCGSEEEDCFGYNLPETIASIHDALAAIDEQSWDELVQKRIDLYLRESSDLQPYVADLVAQELETSRMALETMHQAYGVALERGFGVACEYSL